MLTDKNYLKLLGAGAIKELIRALVIGSVSGMPPATRQLLRGRRLPLQSRRLYSTVQYSPVPHPFLCLKTLLRPGSRVLLVWQIQMSLRTPPRQYHHADHAARATVPLDRFL